MAKVEKRSAGGKQKYLHQLAEDNSQRFEVCIAWFCVCEEFLTSWNLPGNFFWSVFLRNNRCLFQNLEISRRLRVSEWRCVLWECLSSRQFVYRHHTTCHCRRKLLTSPVQEACLNYCLGCQLPGELRYDEVNLCRCATLVTLVTCYLGYVPIRGITSDSWFNSG